MKKKQTLLLLSLFFVLLMGGASVLYGTLSSGRQPDRLAVNDTKTEPADGTDVADRTDAADAAASENGTAPADGDDAPEKIPAPDFTVYDLDGGEVRLSDYLGKPVVVNFWASWCGPCQMEMPDFQDKYDEFGKKIQFLMVNMTDGSRETTESASDFIARQGFTFPVFYDTQSDAAMTYGAYSLPTTYFIDAEGYAVAQATGMIDADTLQRGIDLITPGETTR